MAFGLRLKTPAISDTRASKYVKEQEARSAGNALFQSYGLLTIRALGTFMRRVWKNRQWKHKIFLMITVYDSIYLDIPNTPEAIKWTNDNLVECMLDISGCPELKHDIVELAAQLCTYIPSWKYECKLPNKASKKELIRVINEYQQKLKEENEQGN